MGMRLTLRDHTVKTPAPRLPPPLHTTPNLAPKLPCRIAPRHRHRTAMGTSAAIGRSTTAETCTWIHKTIDLPWRIMCRNSPRKCLTSIEIKVNHAQTAITWKAFMSVLAHQRDLVWILFATTMCGWTLAAGRSTGTGTGTAGRATRVPGEGTIATGTGTRERQSRASSGVGLRARR